jgi:hypothetical protein
VAPILTDTFEAYVAGALANQGPWTAAGTGTDPRIDVVGGSLLDGVMSVHLHDLGGGPTSDAEAAVTLSPTIQTGHAYRIYLRAIAPVGAVAANQFDIFLMTGASPTFTLKVYDDGAGNSKISVQDMSDPAGAVVDPSVAVNAKFRIELMLGADGYYSLYANGVKVRDNKQMLDAGGATNYLDVLMLHTDGTMPAVSTVYDTILIERGAEPVGEGVAITGNAPAAKQGHNAVPTVEGVGITGNTPAAKQGHNASASEPVTVTPNTVVAELGTLALSRAGVRSQECFFLRQTRQEADF